MCEYGHCPSVFAGLLVYQVLGECILNCLFDEVLEVETFGLYLHIITKYKQTNCESKTIEHSAHTESLCCTVLYLSSIG